MTGSPVSERSFLTDVTSVITEVEEWLLQYNMPEWIDTLKSQGYDDLEDLRVLASSEPKTFELLISKPGHRKKIIRLLFGTDMPTGADENDTQDFEPNQGNGVNGLPLSMEGNNSNSSPDSPATIPRRESFAKDVPQRSLPTQDVLRMSPSSAFSAVKKKTGSEDSETGTIPSSAPISSNHSTHSFKASEPSDPDEVLLKIIIVGESACGKTSYIRQLVDGRFSPNIRSTVGLDFSEKKFNMKGSSIMVQFWDISGQERFTSMTRSYYKGAHGAIVCYDLSRPKSFEMVERWKKDIDSKVFFNDDDSYPIPAILMGCKRDLDKRIDMSSVQMAKYCAEHHFIGWFETSAKTNYNVKEAAEYLVTEIMKLNPRGSKPDPKSQLRDDNIMQPIKLNKPVEKKKRSCCPK